MPRIKKDYSKVTPSRQTRVPLAPWDFLGDAEPNSYAYLDAIGQNMSEKLVLEIGATVAVASYDDFFIFYTKQGLDLVRFIIKKNTLCKDLM